MRLPRILAMLLVATLWLAAVPSSSAQSADVEMVAGNATTDLQQPAFITPLPAKPRGTLLPQRPRSTSNGDRRLGHRPGFPNTVRATSPALASQAAPAKNNDGIAQTSYNDEPNGRTGTIKLQRHTAASPQKTAVPASSRTITGPKLSSSNQPPSVIDAAEYVGIRPMLPALNANLQTPADPPTTDEEAPASPPANLNDPCAALANRPFHEFGINIAMPAGETPTDFATTCWQPINDSAGPLAGTRAWAVSSFAWDATSLCHRPLYFEEYNLERYGYGCCEALQPAASAAHFFGTLPALPYCMAVDCPGECIYTLGHYRPGSCNPKRCIWPPLSPRAILAEGGVWTGLVFLIP